jgi:hypothetical protein
VHYVQRIQNGVDEKNWQEVSKIFGDYIKTYEPEAIANMKPFYNCKDRNEAEIWSFFSQMHERRATVFRLAADTLSARKETDIAVRLKEAANF